jgi:hypothetical protein
LVIESANERISFRASRSTANELESRAFAAGLSLSAYVLWCVEQDLAIERAISRPIGSRDQAPPLPAAPAGPAPRPS